MTQSYNDPNNTPASDELDEILMYAILGEDAISLSDSAQLRANRAKAAITALRIKDRIDELMALRTKQGGHIPDELCCELCDRLTELESQLNIGGSNAKQ